MLAQRLATISLAVALTVALGGCVFDFGSFTRTDPLKQETVFGDSGPKIAMLEIDGMISESRPSSPLGLDKPSMVARAREALDKAEDDDVEALILRIRSPGGTVSASETLYHEVLRWKERTQKPVVAYFQGLATSGGYYVAMASDEIVAHPTAITGSIGVIMAGINFAGLMDRFGVEDQTFASGAFKDSGSPLRPMRADERKLLEGVVDNLAERFAQVVVLGRPHLEAEQVRAVADGRIFTADQALRSGLIDRVGHLEDAVTAAEARAGLSESRLVVYKRPGEFRQNIYSHASPAVQVIDIDVLSVNAQRLEPGFYYLWPYALAGSQAH